MIKQIVLTVSLLAIAGVASASGSSNSCRTCSTSHGSDTENTVKADSYSKSDSWSKSNAESLSKSDSYSKSTAEGGSADQNQRQDQTMDNSGNASVNVDASTTSRRNPVNTAYAAALTSSNDTCMGSSSAGAQGITFGLSFGTTWKDDDCVKRKDARFLHNIQRTEVGLSLMCQKDSIRLAVERAGTRADRIACGLPAGPEEVSDTYIEVDTRNELYRSGESG